MRVAIDDAGAGFSSLRHTLSLEPDIVKLDISLTRDIDNDRAKRALASALVPFGDGDGHDDVIAEGIETGAELEALARARRDVRTGILPGRAGPLGRRIRFVGDPRPTTSPAVAFVNDFISVAIATASA